MARHGRHGAPRAAVRTGNSAFRVFTRHETRITAFMLFTNHSFPTHDFPPFPTISRHFPAPPPPSADQVSTRRPPFLVSRPDCRAARSLLCCALWGGMGRLWSGMGGMGRPEPLFAHRPHRQQGLSGFHETRITNHGFFRITAFLHAREFPYNHWRAAGCSSPACPHGSRRWLDTSPHL